MGSALIPQSTRTRADPQVTRTLVWWVGQYVLYNWISFKENIYFDNFKFSVDVSGL